MKKLTQAVKNTIPVLAEAMENVCRSMLIFSYQLRHTRWAKGELHDTLDNILPDFNRYKVVVQKLKTMSKQRKALLAEKAALPKLNVIKQAELSRQIAALTEDMEELRSEKAALIISFYKTDDVGMKEIRQRVDGMEASLQKLEQAEVRYSVELDKALAEYKELVEQSADLDADMFSAERQSIRPAMTQDAIARIKAAYSQRYNYDHMRQAQRDVVELLDEKPEKQRSVREQLKDMTTATSQQEKSIRKKEMSDELLM